MCFVDVEFGLGVGVDLVEEFLCVWVLDVDFV